jgi:rhamnose utilization protein RhaD (predicted bifunctional aldolase and dehydrogenase)
MFLAKHGLFVTAETPNAALKLVKMVTNRCAKGLLALKTAPAPVIPDAHIAIAAKTIRSAFKDATGRNVDVTHHPDSRIIAFARRKDARKILAPGPLSPNEMAYTHGAPMLVNLDRKRIASRLTTQTKAHRLPSLAFIIKDVGLFLAGEKSQKQTMFDTVMSSLFIRSNAIRFGGIVALTKAQQDFICKFESA